MVLEAWPKYVLQDTEKSPADKLVAVTIGGTVEP